MHHLSLLGCSPTPLAHYLKALGVLRLVAEQADPQARGAWHGERFTLITGLDADALENFFLYEYRPTPLVAPWNKGSGFYNNDPVLPRFVRSAAPRFAPLRAGIDAANHLLGEQIKADEQVRSIKGESTLRHLSGAQKKSIRESADYKSRLADAERSFKELKQDLIPNCRLTWRGPHREWLDAAMVIDGDDIPRFPALLGTGGNDGRLDFTNNFMQRLADVFDTADEVGKPQPKAAAWLQAALWQEPALGYLSNASVGQFLPGTAGGANNSTGPDADSLLNPFDFILLLEGAVLFTAHATRRLGAAAPSKAAAPFAVSAHGAGYSSAGDSDESARGEQWMPLWAQPLSLSELRRLLSEGRAQLGTRPIRDPIDLAQAIARLGTARGITTFQRFGYIERNGQSNLAVPLGRFHVPRHISPQLACLDDLHRWVARLRRETREGSARLKQAEKALSDSIFTGTQHPDEPRRWRSVLLALSAVEAVQVTGSGHGAGPIPPLRPAWIDASADGSAESRLALALALQTWGDSARSNEPPPSLDTVRRHWIPLSENGRAFEVNDDKRLQPNASVVMNGRRGLDDAIALVNRRLIESAQRGQWRLPLAATSGFDATARDLTALLHGHVDLDQTLSLARAFMALDKNKLRARAETPSGDDLRWPDDGWLAIRLSLLPWSLIDGHAPHADPAILRRLVSGDASGAVDLALKRLLIFGIRATIRATVLSPQTARLWAAALAFPISDATAKQFTKRLASKYPNHNEESRS